MDTLPHELLVDAFKYTSKIPLIFKSTKTLKHCAYFLDHQAIVLANFDFSENWERFNVVAVVNNRRKKIKIRKNGAIKNMPKNLLYLNLGPPFDNYDCNGHYKKTPILLPKSVKYLLLDGYEHLNTLSSNVSHFTTSSKNIHQLPRLLESLTHLNIQFFNNNVKIPETLTHLSISGEGSFPIEFPKNLKKLKICEGINPLFNQFPIGLTHLSIYQKMDLKSQKWPMTLISLKLAHSTTISKLPIFLTHLTCSSETIKELKWPIYLTYLFLRDTIHITHFPKNLEYLYVYSPQPKQFDLLPFCPSISIKTCYNQPILKLKNNIQFATGTIQKLSLDSSLSYCRMNLILDSITKSDLTHLTIYSDTIGNDVVTWLNNLADNDMMKLTHLKLMGRYGTINKLPQTITYLKFTTRHGTIIKLPSNLKFLNTNVVNCPPILPKTLKCLSYNNITGLTLPRSLRYIRTEYKHFDLIPAFVKFVVLI